MSSSDLDEEPTPTGELVLQTLALPKDTNSNGDVFGGWLMSQMDLAGAIAARELAKGRVTTVAVGAMHFLRPVPVGATVSCYCEILEVGRSSIKALIEVWVKHYSFEEQQKVTDGEFVYVSIDNAGRTRPVYMDR
ncbi:acyl-CoA thioesterase [Saccharophagus degradans]|uniref:Thioesterase superfamily n=2 Tax=Saccharophagus degradans TaxID=86304 RepID=Q21E66_SACD2|nr:acyl-CoA thioesterase [Saccharophagus degradans]ABD83013.1 thioesterase superfamily [Saccharophagus degradans 2-40]MBU2984926.1 acyl-CoA thioesterase [Saccharophagus degradans]MDO6423845.1 acyl-CoA thioesterase [Saccharophagus degradans]MDO6607925.1 acyl-CoA thioesterase [Saccharophagus degradans]WGO98806.1 acyl-CoA thioesterase [Saccharophagus degradans]